MFVKPNLKQFKTNAEQLFNKMTIATIAAFKILGSCNAHNTTCSCINVSQLQYVAKASSMQTIRMSMYTINLLSSFCSSIIQFSFSQIDKLQCNKLLQANALTDRM